MKKRQMSPGAVWLLAFVAFAFFATVMIVWIVTLTLVWVAL